jgi:hypothetical protein
VQLLPDLATAYSTFVAGVSGQKQIDPGTFSRRSQFSRYFSASPNTPGFVPEPSSSSLVRRNHPEPLWYCFRLFSITLRLYIRVLKGRAGSLSEYLYPRTIDFDLRLCDFTVHQRSINANQNLSRSSTSHLVPIRKVFASCPALRAADHCGPFPLYVPCLHCIR